MGGGIHPGFVLIATALAAALFRARARRVVVVAGCAGALIAWSLLDFLASVEYRVGDYRLHLLHVDPLSLVFGLVFVLVAFIGSLYGLHRDDRGDIVSALVYAGSAVGAVFAGDLLTLFAFWEMMAVSSLFIVWNGKTAAANGAGYRYLLVHGFGGSMLLAGILVHLARGGSPTVSSLVAGGADPLAFWLMLVGVSVNAAIPPLHAWLTDAYPEASVSGSVFLSAFTTKCAVYVLLRLFSGAEVLVWAGALMAVYGVIYAILENDIRRLLGYHIVSQVGYMVAGAGLGTPLGTDGATAHAFSHILYKALLFMGAGAVVYATGRRKLTELGGLASRMKLVLVLYTVGSFSISGVPLFNGFISKSMVVSAAAESHYGAVELLLTLASVGTFLSVGLKLPYFAFFGERREIEIRKVPRSMLVGMGVAAALCVVYGLVPGLLYGMLPFRSEYHPFTVDHVVSSVQLLVGTAIGFYVLLHKLHGERKITLDTDWFYRVPLARATAALITGVRELGTALESLAGALVHRLSEAFEAPRLPFDFGRDAGTVDHDPYRFRSPIGLTVFWISVYFVLLALAALLRI